MTIDEMEADVLTGVVSRQGTADTALLLLKMCVPHCTGKLIIWFEWFLSSSYSIETSLCCGCNAKQPQSLSDSAACGSCAVA